VDILANRSLEEAIQLQPSIRGGINVKDGKVTCKAVAEALGMDFADLD